MNCGGDRGITIGIVKTVQTQSNLTYLTDHLYLAAFLACSGHEVVGTTFVGSRVSFEFTQTPTLSADVASFMSGASVPARQFSFEVLKLKRLLPKHTVKRDSKDGHEEITR